MKYYKPHQAKNLYPKKQKLNDFSNKYSKNTYDFSLPSCSDFAPKMYNAEDYQLKSGLKFKPKNIKSVSASGIAFDSMIERIYYFYKKEIEHAFILRNTTEHLIYHNCYGKDSWFYPDFIENGTFVEIKGILSPDDNQKRQQHPQVIWIVQSEPYGKQVLAKMKEKLDILIPDWKKL